MYAEPSFEVLWKQTFSYSGYRMGGESIRMTSDGGFVMVRSILVAAPHQCDLWLQKVDTNGNQQWNRTCADKNDSYAFSVDQTSDGGYIISGITGVANGSGREFTLVKVDQYGNDEWNKTYAGDRPLRGMSVKQTADGGYIVAGDNHVSVVKTYFNGSLEWRRTCPSSSGDEARIIRQTSDGGYIILTLGDLYYFEFGRIDGTTLLIKIDGEGTLSGTGPSLAQ